MKHKQFLVDFQNCKNVKSNCTGLEGGSLEVFIQVLGDFGVGKSFPAFFQCLSKLDLLLYYIYLHGKTL